MLGLGPGHDAEDGHKLDGQHTLAGRDDPQHFGGGALGALEHFPHPINGGRDDGKRKRPLALGEQLVHVGVGSGELEGLGRIRGLLGGFLFLDGLPLGRGLDDVAEGGVDLGVDLLLGEHTNGMRHRDEAHVRQPLALLRAPGEGYELVGYDCYRGDAHLFEIALVNYQP